MSSRSVTAAIQSTDSVWTGCRANSAPATKAQTRSPVITLGEHKDEVDHENVEQKADEMEALGPQAEEPVADKVSPASSSAGSNW